MQNQNEEITSMDITNNSFDTSNLTANNTSSAPLQSTSQIKATGTYNPSTDGLLDDIPGSLHSTNNPVKDATKGLLDDSVSDINKLTASDNPLMKQAGARGAQAANSRGLLNSSMGVQAGQAAALDTVMPLVQQNADVRGNTVLQNNETNNSSRLMGEETNNSSRLMGEETQNKSQLMGQQFTIDQRLMIEEFVGKENLINLESEWNHIIQSNINAAESLRTDMDGIMDILNNKDLGTEQVQNRINLAFGTENDDGTIEQGYIGATLEFISGIANMNFPEINTNVLSSTVPTGAVADINDPDGYTFKRGVDDPRTLEDESRSRWDYSDDD